MTAKDTSDIAVTKGQFATLIGVSPGRISQYLAEGKISPAALVGTGRNARISVEQAKADLRISIDVGQRFGNGLETRLDADEQEQPRRSGEQQTTRAAETIVVSGIDREIKEQKLEQIRRANRNAGIADALTKGTLMLTKDAKAEMGRVAGTMLSAFEGSLPDLATSISAEFKVPQRDVLLVLRKEFRAYRSKTAKALGDLAGDLPATHINEIPAHLTEPAD